MATGPLNRPFPLTARISIGKDAKGNDVFASKVLLDQINNIWAFLGGFSGTSGADYATQIAEIQATLNALIAVVASGDLQGSTMQPLVGYSLPLDITLQPSIGSSYYDDVMQSAQSICCNEMLLQG